MTSRRFVRTCLAALAATFALAGGAQAATSTTGYGPTPSQAEIDNAIASLENGSGRIVQLKAETPSWYTPELARRVAAQGVVSLAQHQIDGPLPGEVGIRPGSWMISPAWCTMNYLFRNGSTLAIGTAGHCIDGGDPVVLLTLAPGGQNPVLVQLGKVLLKRDAGIGQDYALVEIPANLHSWAFPTVAGVGGPCGIYDGGEPLPVAHYGHGAVGGTGGTPRAGVGFEAPLRGWDLQWDADSIVWAGYVYGGDSGSAVRVAQLPAVSNLTHGIGVTGLEPSPIGWGTRVTTITGSGWALDNSPLCPPGTPDTSGGGGGSTESGGNKGGKGGKPEKNRG